eukprot:476334-Alexandrium_andersonii.AAC.1
MSVYVAALIPAVEAIGELSPHVICLQEHSTAPDSIPIAKAKLRDEGYACAFSPCGPEASRPAGGVAVACKWPITCQ